MKTFKTLTSRAKYTIVSDNGNYTTKTSCGENSVIIHTLLSKGKDKMSHSAYVIDNYNGESYVIGDENKTSNTNIKLSKIDLAHKLTCYTAIHQLVPDNCEVDLYVGLPLNTFYNLDYRNEYIEFMHDETIDMTINGVKKKIYINEVKALPEGIGYVFSHNVSGLVGVVDIGHLTVDGAIYQDCAPILTSVFTFVGGANSLKTLIRDELNNKLLLNIQDYQLEEILIKGLYGEHRENANTIIKECKIKYLKSIANEMIKHGWELSTLPIVFTGGGSLLLHDVIDMFDTFSLSDEPLFDNMNGFAELGVLLDD